MEDALPSSSKSKAGVDFEGPGRGRADSFWPQGLFGGLFCLIVNCDTTVDGNIRFLSGGISGSDDSKYTSTTLMLF